MSEFHMHDAVINRKLGIRFLVTGIAKGTNHLLYCGRDVGWTSEHDLDYDINEMQREALIPVERLTHDLRTSAADMSAKLVLLKEKFGGKLPEVLVTELDAIILMLRSHIEL